MNSYPDLSWTQFLQCCTGDPRLQFEEMCRRLFIAEYLHGKELPQAETSHPGIEVDPVLEPIHEDGSPRKRISFQSKFFDNSVSYSQIKDSAVQAAKHYKGKLDLIYLFSNLTLNPSRSSTYQETVKLLEEAGIELKPLSNGAVLDLVFKHDKIARYYFLPRNRSFSYNGEIHVAMSAGAVDSEAQTVDKLPDRTSSIYHHLLEEKLLNCRSLLLDLKLTQLKAELDCLHDVANQDIMFLEFLVSVHGNDLTLAAELKNKLNNQYRYDAEWLYAFCNSPREIGYQELSEHLPETQVILFIELLNKQRLDNLVKIHDDASHEKLDEHLNKAFSFYYSIALFNLHRVKEARDELRKLDDAYHSPAYKFFYYCADMQIKNQEYGFGTKEKANELEACLRNLKDVALQVEHLYKNNEKLIGMLELQAYYNLSSFDDSYLERATDAFNSLNDQAKKDSHILYFLGMCHELAGEFETALEIYSRPECSQDEIVFYRMAVCLLRLNRDEELYNRLKDYETDNSGIIGAKLAVEYRLKIETYRDDLKVAVEKHGYSLDNLFPIVYHTEDTDAFNECVKDRLVARIDIDLDIFDDGRKAALLLILLRHKQLPIVQKVLNSGIDLKNLNGFIVHQLYDILISIVNRENKKKEHNFTPSSELILAEKISDVFIEADAYTDRFLHVRLGCLSAQERHFAMLKDSKRLFELTGDLGVARNIVALLYSQNEKRADEYEPYLSVLSQSDIPAHAMAVCSGAMRLGNSAMAERYAYKALYLLNGKDDYEIYRNYFSYVSGFVLKNPDDRNSKHVSDNMVVELQNNYDANDKLLVCLDSEADFIDEQNRSLDIDHLRQGDANYTKLIRAGIGQVIKVFGNHYKVTGFMPRAVHAFHYINGKIKEHPEKFDGVVFLISTEDPQKMLDEIKKYTDRTEQTNHILACYHFEAIESGIPIEMVCNGDYSRYIDTVRMLLYGKDQAFYAGLAEPVEELKGPYVPTLSTIVLLSQLEELRLLEALRDKIGVIIPESYIEFFEELFANSSRMMEVSPGTLHSDNNGKLVMVENDKHIPEMWEEILLWCRTCERKTITNEERADFVFPGDETGDHLISAMNINKIQLDALILAKKLNTVYISDDLFMRKVASWAGIQNNNFTFLLNFLLDNEYAEEITVELSKTNYVYTPIYTAGHKSQEVIQNLMIGKRKRQLYGVMLERIRQAFMQAMGISQDIEEDSDSEFPPESENTEKDS